MRADEAVFAWLQTKGRPASLEEIADGLHLSLRSVKRSIYKLTQRGLLRVQEIPSQRGRIKLYETAVKSLEAWHPPPLTKIESLEARLNEIKQRVDTRALERCKEYILTTSPKDLQKELIDFLGEKRDLFKNKKEKDEESRHKYRRFNEELRFVEATEWIGEIARCKEEIDLKNGLVLTGSDASRDFLDMVWKCGMIPIFLKIVVNACAGVSCKYVNGEPTYIIKREPEFPLSAGGMYLEELSTKYPNLDERERSTLALIMMNIAHFQFDSGIIAELRPFIHFHDGRLLPPHMHFMDFYYEWRRPYLWTCLDKAFGVRNTAEGMECKLVGVVKEPHPETAMMSKLLGMLLEKFAGIEYGKIGLNEFSVIDTILREGEASWIFRVKPREIYLPESSMKSALTALGDDELELQRYVNHVERAEHCFFYMKHREAGASRYEYYPKKLSDPTQEKDTIANYAHATSTPLGGPQWRAERYMAIVPSVIYVADNEAKSWVKSTAELISHHLRIRLLGGT